jgi:hypothetical protein
VGEARSLPQSGAPENAMQKRTEKSDVLMALKMLNFTFSPHWVNPAPFWVYPKSKNVNNISSNNVSGVNSNNNDDNNINNNNDIINNNNNDDDDDIINNNSNNDNNDIEDDTNDIIQPLTTTATTTTTTTTAVSSDASIEGRSNYRPRVFKVSIILRFNR